MLSSIKQIVNNSRTNDSAYGANNTNNGESEFDHNNHKVRPYKYASNLNGSKWDIKVTKT